MEIRKLSSELKTIYDSMSGTEIEGAGGGWVNMAGFGLELSRNGINYKHYGYEKLRTFIESMPEMFEIYRDDSLQPPVFYLRTTEEAMQDSDFAPDNEPQPVTVVRPSVPRLVDWAWLGHFQSVMQDLAEMAIEESWDFETPQGRNYSILINYLTYTFAKIYDEGKIAYSDDGRWAAFNTGLVTKVYKPIFALFDKNRNEGQQEWHLYDFCVEGEERAGKILVSEFAVQPEPAQYFNSIYDLLYDVQQGVPSLDHRHIIIERLERYPYRILKEFAPEGFDMIRPENLTEGQRAAFFRRLKSALENDINSYSRFKDKIDSAVQLAVKRVQWNYKSAIPMYYPKTRSMCLLLPLCLKDQQHVDLALVVSKGKSGRYQGETIYPLDWAYRNARLVCRPDSDWLAARSIHTSSENPDERRQGRFQR